MAKSSKKLKRENFLETHLQIMIWIGLSRPINTHPLISALFMFRMIIIIGNYVLLMTGCVAHIRIVNEYDLLASSINILQLIVYGMGIMHILYYGIRNVAVHALIGVLRESFTFASNTGHFTMDEPTRWDERRSIGWTGLCMVAVTGWFALAVAKGYDPIPVWAPVNLQESPYYEIDTLLQFTGQFLMGSIGGCFGFFCMSVLSLYRYQIKMLIYSLEHMAPLAALRTWKRVDNGNEKLPSAMASEDYTHKCECCTEEFKRIFGAFEKRWFNNALTPLEKRAYEEELYDTLKDCIVHHQNIVKVKNAVEDFFGPVMLIRFVFSTMMLCFTVYSSSKIMAKEDFNFTDVTFISLMEYFLVAVGELFLFCYIANNLLSTSMELPNVIFEKLPWHGGRVEKKFISTWKIFHMSAMKPISLRTPFYVISLDVFRAVLRTSFSFYTLLRRLQNA